MQESTTYQAILKEGEVKGEAKGLVAGVRKSLLLVGTRRFGAPDARIRKALNAIRSAEHMERLMERSLDATSWDDLLAS